MAPNAVTLSLILLLFHVTIHQSHATSVALEARDPQEDDVTTTTAAESIPVDLRPFHVSSSLLSNADPELSPKVIAHSLRPLRVRCRGGSHVSTARPIELPYGNDMLMENNKMEENTKKKKKKLKKNSGSDSDSDSDSDDEEDNEEKEMKNMRKMKWKKEGSRGFLSWISKYLN